MAENGILCYEYNLFRATGAVKAIKMSAKLAAGNLSSSAGRVAVAVTGADGASGSPELGLRGSASKHEA